MVAPTHPDSIASQLEALRTELAELAFTYDRQGHPAAVDVAMFTSARLAELCAQLVTPVQPRAEAAAHPRHVPRLLE